MHAILGQTRAIHLLTAAMRLGKLHHAFIFHGPPGVGKFTTALALARILLCHQPAAAPDGAARACGACPSCRLLLSARPGGAEDDAAADLGRAHPDLHIITKELARFHEEKTIRERKQTNIPWPVLEQFLLEPAYRSAALKHGKVFIIDEAELIDPGGQNRLLKTLEEPPAQRYFILISAQEDRLLPTVRSRCQRIPFASLPPQVLEDWLAQSPAAANLAPAEKQWLLTFASGSLGRLQLAIDYNLTTWTGRILPLLDQLEKAQFAPELGKTMAECVDEFATRWVDEHDNASKEAANRRGAGLLILLLSQIARRRLAQQAERAAGLPEDQAQPFFEPWLKMIEALSSTEAQLAANLNMGQVCEHLALHLFLALMRVGAHTAGSGVSR